MGENTMKSQIIFIGLFIALLISCSDSQAKPVTPSATPIVQKAVPSPTRTLAPTDQPKETLPATLNAQQILDAAVQLCPDGTTPIYPYLSFSPNREWMAVVCLDKDVLLKFVKADGQLSWEIPSMKDFHWSNDGNYVYLIPASFWPGADSPELMFIDGNSLHKLDLKSGELITALEDLPHDSYSFSFSPDDRFLVYSSHPTNFTIQMIDFHSAERVQFSLPDEYSRAGIFLWSPDGQQVVFAAVKKGDWYSFESNFSIYLIDIPTKQLIHLLNQPSHKYYADQWLSQNKVHVVGFDEPGEFELDVTTWNFTEIVQTPTP